MPELPRDVQPNDAAADDEKVRSHDFSPDLPRGLAGFPQVLEIGFLSQGVHARPKAIMLVPHHLPLADQSLGWFPLPRRIIAVNVIKDFFV